MKRTLLILLLSGVSCFLHATAITAITNNGDWATTSTWDLGRIPQGGDTVVIPSGIQITVKNNQTLGAVMVAVNGILMLQTSGELDLGANSVVVVPVGGQVTGTGNPSERISIGGDVKYQEKINGTFNGPGYITGSTPAYNAVGGGFTPGTMPLVLVGFSASGGPGNSIVLRWSTASEENTRCFVVQGSHDLGHWSDLGTVPAAGNSAELLHYNYVDAQQTASGACYYRLVLTDIDGHSSFSPIVSFHNNSNKAAALSVWPNPVQRGSDSLAVSWNNAYGKAGQLSLYSAGGVLVSQAIVPAGEQAHVLTPGSLPAGMYVVQLRNGQHSYLQQVLVQ